MSFKKNLGRKLLSRLPESLGRLVYAVAFKLLKLAIAFTVPASDRPQIWARNSWVLGTFVPFLSDLDLTFWFENEPNPKVLRKILDILGAFSRIFPFLGESNVYVAKDREWIIDWMNPLELQRDPTLRVKVGEVSATPQQTSVFILRMLEGDVQNVLFCPEFRKKKWNSHFETAQKLHGRPLKSLWENFPERSLLRAITETSVAVSGLTDSHDFSQAIESLERYFECFGRRVPLHTLPTEKWWWIFLPHRFCYGDNQPPLLNDNPVFVALFKAQVQWELFGVLSQYRFSSNRDAIARHVNSLKSVAEFAVKDAAFLKKINTLLERILNQS